MRVPRLITLGMATVAVSVAAGGGAVLLREAANDATAADGANAAAITVATLAAETKLQDERAATTEALAHRAAVGDSRSATDAALDAVTKAVRSQDAAWSRDIPVRLAASRQHLKEIRQRADALLAEPRADRSETELRQLTSDMTAIVSELSPVLDIAEATLARTDPNAGNLATTARLATEMRDYAGRLNLALTAFNPNPATDANRLQALIEQLRRFFGRTAHDREAEKTLDDTERQVREGLQARQAGGSTDAPSGEGAGFNSALQSAGKLADGALAQLTERMQTTVAGPERSFGLIPLIMALILAAAGVICWIMRARIFESLGVASEAARRIAGGEQDVKIAIQSRPDETGTNGRGLELVRALVRRKARTEAALPGMAGKTRRRTPESRSEQQAASKTKSGLGAMLRHVIRFRTAPAEPPPPDDTVLDLPFEMIVDDTIFDPARASFDGKERFNGFVVSAAFLNGCIRDSIAAEDRDALQAAARRLSNTSRSAGAIRIGMLAHTLDEVAQEANPARLVDLENDIVSAFALTSAEIKRFTATLPG